ncbi:N-6 DNA methylase [Streptomyces hydrogenans]|uniref:N-6 DNA methylase n=1 Tax=Streptomyces hydrogenans TaxID=1873719 RepID=UPI00342B99DF
MSNDVVVEAVSRLASRDSARTEADLQADLYLLLTAGGLSLGAGDVARLEVATGDGTRRRIDVEIGHCVIEVKKDLRPAGIHREAEIQLAGYVKAQSARLETRYVGILTDGTDWFLYNLVEEELRLVAKLSLNPSAPDAEQLVVWIESILATRTSIKPTPEEIVRQLGAKSPAHLLDHASLQSLYEQASEVPEVQLKRDLWAKLLRTAFGKSFTNDEQLFIDHTLLVLTAEIIAHAVIGFDITRTGNITPAALIHGTSFTSAQIHGVVESDFFDWVLKAPGGQEFVAELADRIARFDWATVEHDVLKVLYESIIASETREDLGEYYTPDWLADRIVASSVTSPLKQRVLDPSCGSGTFLFHSIRAYLDAADKSGMENGRAVDGVTRHVFGMDVHPVAVALARVTYLLAIGTERLSQADRGQVNIPVYLGDSLQWEQHRDLFGGADEVSITTAGSDLVEGGGALFGDDLVFPRRTMQDAGDFDRLVTAMADKAIQDSPKSSRDLISPTLRQLGIHAHDVDRVTETFDTMRRLHASGRNHIWGYYVRNLIRPLWLSEQPNKVDVLVGNPPWLRYSKMTTAMQARYKTLAKQRGLLGGGLGGSARDLSTLFVVRCIELYLKPAGKFSFVMPHGTLTRKPHDGFRSGKWTSGSVGVLTAAFSESWDLSEATTGFPTVSCVVHGSSTDNKPRRIPQQVQLWRGRLRTPNLTWEAAKGKFTVEEKNLTVLDSAGMTAVSAYKSRFRQGAVLAPRALLFVKERPSGPLGAGAGRVSVESRRSVDEKPPWKNIPSLTGTVERAFFKKVHLGETLLPFRMLEPLRAVLPVSEDAVMDHGAIEEHAALAHWWSEAEAAWERDKKAGSKEGALLGRIDYHGQMRAQLPASRQRVAYTKAGNYLAAARIEEPDAIIDHKLYWAAASSLSEARYLVAVLNSGKLAEKVRPLQTIGLFGPRDFDKHIFDVAIPIFEERNEDHAELVELSFSAEVLASQVDVSQVPFKVGRGLVRDALTESGISAQIDAVIDRLIPDPVIGR